jgi:hypothetical protein
MPTLNVPIGPALTPPRRVVHKARTFAGTRQSGSITAFDESTLIATA